jgi:uncharacterized SAM-binding protein YcdF (DUF218 family)
MIVLIKFLLNNLVAILIITFAVLYFFKRYKKIQYILFLIIILITISPFPNFLVYSFERLHKPGDINNLDNTFDKIVILSGNEDYIQTKRFNQFYLGGSNNRIIEGLRIHHKFNKKIIFSGSSTTTYKNNKRDIYVAKKFFKEFKVSKKFLIFDEKSENTLDTFVFLKENFPNKKHLILTSAMHMLRCKMLAKKNNIDFILYAVDYKSRNKSFLKFNFDVGENIRLFNYGLREISALLFYKLSGKI